MKVIDFFHMGGMPFMVLVSLSGITMLFFSAKTIVNYFVKKDYTKRGLNLILLFGSLSLIIGMLAQAIGMFMAFNAIEVAADISPALVVGGFKASMIAPLYGAFIFIFSLIIWGILREILLRKTENK